MELVGNTKHKLQSVLRLIDVLKEGDFPHEHSKAGLIEIEETIKKRLNEISKLTSTSSPDVVQRLCSEAASKVEDVYPLIGFIKRSTDVINAFEFHGPFLRLVNKSLGENAKLIISSETEFSPFTFIPEVLSSTDIVFIGIPASECSNSLVFPLAGHELGHNIWKNFSYIDQFEKPVAQHIVNHIENDIWDNFTKRYNQFTDPKDLVEIWGMDYWQDPWKWALRQCEEIFCDFIGLIIFREAYLKAFAYLIAPGAGIDRDPIYPAIQDRVEYLLFAANELDIHFDQNYRDLFIPEKLSSGEIDFLISISDHAVHQVFTEIYEVANKFSIDKQLVDHDNTNVEKIIKEYELGIPTRERYSLSEIINAGWSFKSSEFQKWKKYYPQLINEHEKREAMLNELILKSIEVHEVYNKLNI